MTFCIAKSAVTLAMHDSKLWLLASSWKSAPSSSSVSSSFPTSSASSWSYRHCVGPHEVWTKQAAQSRQRGSACHIRKHCIQTKPGEAPVFEYALQLFGSYVFVLSCSLQQLPTPPHHHPHHRPPCLHTQ